MTETDIGYHKRYEIPFRCTLSGTEDEPYCFQSGVRDELCDVAAIKIEIFQNLMKGFRS